MCVSECSYSRLAPEALYGSLNTTHARGSQLVLTNTLSIPVVGQESFGEDEPSLLVAFDVVGPLL